MRAGAERRMAADVRLILPGDCLLCFGGLRDPAGAVERLRAPDPEPPDDWRSRRAGSLRSLNSLATSLALRLLEDLAAGDVARSTWLHVEWDSADVPRIEHREASGSLGCRLCACWGLGDVGLPLLPRLLDALDAEPRPDDPFRASG